MARVEFYAGSTLLGSDTSSPYSFTWVSAPAGSHTLKAMAFDADGGQATSSTVTITVEPGPNQAPSVTLTSPAGGATFTAPASIDVTATASDPENQLARVEFYQGATLLGSDSSSPYSFTWSSAPAGSYTLTARAFDADGAQTTSSAVSITVQAPNQLPSVGADLTCERRGVHRAGDRHHRRVGIGSGEPARARRVLPGHDAARQ